MNEPNTPPRAPAEENIEKLKAKLRELFQLDRGDLDFGLYRIMALKREQVCQFLDEELLPQVKEALAVIMAADVSILQADLDKLEKSLRDAEVAPETSPKFIEKQKEVAHAKQNEQIEADAYNHLYNFFARYYDEGDFMSLRRYKSAGKESYAIPYNGEEVKLHWANADQYYIKTAENFASYIFTAGDAQRVRFEIAAADAERDNIKEAEGKNRCFVLAEDCIDLQEELTIRFEHRPLTASEKKQYPQNGANRQSEINADAEKRIKAKLSGKWLTALAAPCPTESDEDRSVLGKHLAAYTAKNSFDYFIHKNLGGFLRRELDYYLKNDVISIDHLELTDDPFRFMRELTQVKAIRLVGNKIIDFLAQLEDFQKQLWLKKKFVLETNYCVTLDKIPEKMYAEIAKNKSQMEEWVRLFAIDEIGGKKLSAKFLKENPYLVLDTKHFDQAFTDELLAALSDNGGIEEQMNGLLIHGENFQALNLLQGKYEGQVKCIYIDPPYNTASSPIPYKNNYKHSSWASLLNDRIRYGKILLSDTGFNITTIDYAEFYKLGIILDDIFEPDSRVGIVTIFINPKGRQHEKFFSSSTEYMIVHAKDINKGKFEKTIIDSEKAEEFELIDENGSYRLDEFARIRSSTTKEQKPDFYYPIFVSPDLKELTLERKDGFHEVLPVNNKGEPFSWKVIPKTFEKKNRETQYVAQHDEEGVLKIYNKFYEQQVYKNLWIDKVWTHKKYFPEFQGTSLLKKILGESLFSYPKSVHAVSDALKITTAKNDTVLDYFAGSGTTGHAVINLNREDNGNRKYILAEVGHHFDTVLLPRMKKVTYSKDWKNGKPQDRKGISQLFQYIRLESYEDALDSLVKDFKTDTPQFDMVEGERKKRIIEDYQLRYALGEQTAQCATLLGKDFIKPFDYTLSIVRDGARRDERVDLIETFNFLLGLKLTSRQRIDDVVAIRGTTAKNQNCLILWRDTNQVDAAKLDKWFQKHRAKLSDDLDLIYVNGDNTLAALSNGERWEVAITEIVFRELMFGGAE